MYVGEKLFINLLIIISALFYWYTSNHIIPAILGVVFMILYIIDESFSFVSLSLALFTILFIIYFLFYDYVKYLPSDGTLHFGASVIYMIVIAFKANDIYASD